MLVSPQVLQDTRSNYDTDVFGPLLAAVHELVGGLLIACSS